MVAPVLAHIPGEVPGQRFVDALAWSGERAFAGTALLVVCGVVVAGGAVFRDHRPLAVLIIASAAFTLADAATRSVGIAFAGHVLTIAAFAAIVAVAARGARPAARPVLAGLGLTAFGLAAARWPLLADSWSALLGARSGVGTAFVAWTVAEAALVAAPVAFGIALLLVTTPSRLEWAAATVAALGAGAFLAAEPGYAGLVSIWATGSTLALPTFAYVLSATCVGLVLTHWLRGPSTRHLAAGLVLLAVAGVQPAVAHHNLTAVFALLLLADASPAPSHDVRAAVPERGTVGSAVGALE
ncbi:MAG: hypothetical protein O3B31_03785 [Chloroflexi bacterium]|nr:hypothetical protein [Chloroflexota bacterium]